MKQVLNIPDTLKVGYQKRNGTYTGKLAYVTYLDKSGKLRKEKSWEGWRSKSITPDEFENEPTSGFVLNKKVGDESYGWNPRKAWVRVYDPRGFEFEISVANLLFILEETSSIKGKGLEGEFVYSWDRADLVLLPVTSKEYASSSNIKNLAKTSIKKADMTPGCIYLNSNNEQLIYLDRKDFIDPLFWNGSKLYKNHYVFINNDTNKYEFYRNLTKLVNKETEDPVSNYADLYETFLKSKHHSKVKELQKKPIKSINTIKNKIAGHRLYPHLYVVEYNKQDYIIEAYTSYYQSTKDKPAIQVHLYPALDYITGDNAYRDFSFTVPEEEFYNLDFYTFKIILESGVKLTHDQYKAR